MARNMCVNQLIHESTNMYSPWLIRSSEENFLVERVTKEVMRHTVYEILYSTKVLKNDGVEITCLVVERIFNAEEHGVTKVSHVQIIFGNSV